MFDIGVGEASVSVRHRCWAASWWESASWDEPLSGRCGVHTYEARLDPTLIDRARYAPFSLAWGCFGANMRRFGTSLTPRRPAR